LDGKQRKETKRQRPKNATRFLGRGTRKKEIEKIGKRGGETGQRPRRKRFRKGSTKALCGPINRIL